MDKRIVLKEFTVEAEIFHMDLPEKVANVLISDGFTPKQDLYYDVDIVFDKGVYKIPISHPREENAQRYFQKV